ncbi:MAG: hypothetical protein ACTSRZ_11140 [Promethearchaeota archaeon]
MDILKENNFKIEDMIDQKVDIVGTAQNAKAGAVIVTKNGEVIYIKDMEYWADNLLDVNIKITGFLRYEKYIPDPYMDSDGAISQGSYGMQYTLENVRYEIL